MDGCEILPPEGESLAEEAADFGGKLLLAIAGGLVILAAVLVLVWVAWLSNAPHRAVQHAAPMPGAAAHGHGHPSGHGHGRGHPPGHGHLISVGPAC